MKNEHEGLLSDCRVSMKECESEGDQVECIGSIHSNLLSDKHMPMIRMSVTMDCIGVGSKPEV